MPFPERFRIIDVSQPVNSRTACFPGDVPFSHCVTLSYADSRVINLTAFTMSPHVGTHADAPLHIGGDLSQGESQIGMAGQMSLSPYVGPCVVLDVSPCQVEIAPAQIARQLAELTPVPSRVLFKTSKRIRYDVFEDAYAYFSESVVDVLAQHGVTLIGIDTPSVDHIHSQSLPAHHRMLHHGMSWLENLDLTAVESGRYFLVALPLKLTELEASPIRAVLLQEL